MRNTKTQNPNTKEIPNSKPQSRRLFWSFGLGVCLVFGVWCLVFTPFRLP
jgi:hypothetical protein